MQGVGLDRVDQPPPTHAGGEAERGQRQAAQRQHQQADQAQPRRAAETGVRRQVEQLLLQQAGDRALDHAEQTRRAADADRQDDEPGLAGPQAAAQVPQQDPGAGQRRETISRGRGVGHRSGPEGRRPRPGGRHAVGDGHVSQRPLAVRNPRPGYSHSITQNLLGACF